MTKELVTTNKHRKEDQMANEVQNIAVDVLKVHPRNQEFFDDISGQDYENFKKSISEEGIISEIIVAPDMTIISGHQRYKAAKDLGMKMVPIRIREDLIDEDKKLKVLLAANFGRTKNDEAKQRKVAVEYVKLCGYEQGGDRKSKAQHGLLNLDEIAHQLGTSKTNLKRALSIERNLTDSMKELLDTGIISKTLAADTIASLSPQEQEELISSLDTTKRITQKEMQKYIDEIHSLKANPPKPVDYDSTKRQLEDYKKDYSNLHSQFEDKVKELQDLRKQMENIKRDDPSEKYVKKLQNSVLTFCAKVSTFIEQVGGYVWLTDQINEIPELEREGYIKAVHTIKSWADTMEYNINNKVKVIN